MHDDEDGMIGRMDEDTVLPSRSNVDDTTVNKMDDDNDENSESPLVSEESPSKSNQDPISLNHELSATITTTSTSPSLTRVIPCSTMPMTISKNIDIPSKNDSSISFSVMDISSQGRLALFIEYKNMYVQRILN
jgi:hypothetical protein